MFVLRSLERRQLFGRGLFLMLGFPLRRRFAIDVLPRLILAHGHAAPLCGVAITAGPPIPATTGQAHPNTCLGMHPLVAQLKHAAPSVRRTLGAGIGHVGARSP